MVVPVSYGIPEWSHRVMTARKNYRCANCGDIIPRGVAYERSVERRGPRKGKDPLRNIHMHLDCQAKWYVPEGAHRLKNTARVRRKPETALVAPNLSVASTGALGQLIYQLPPQLAERLAAQADSGLAVAVPVELRNALELMLRAYLSAVGNRKQARKLANLLDELAQLVPYQAPWLDAPM